MAKIIMTVLWIKWKKQREELTTGFCNGCGQFSDEGGGPKEPILAEIGPSLTV